MVEHHHTTTHTHTLLLFIMTYLLLKLPYTSLILESTELIDNLQFSHNYFLGFRSALTMFLQAARRVISKQRNVAIAHRNLRTTAKRKNNVLNQILEGDSGKGILSTKMYHYTVYGSVALFPVALVLSPSVINIPVDVALGLVFPIHAHIGMNYVISDYVPKGLRPAARTGWLAVTAITVLGLLKLNLFGDGMTESVKSMFRDVSPEERRAIAAAAKANATPAAEEEKAE